MTKLYLHVALIRKVDMDGRFVRWIVVSLLSQKYVCMYVDLHPFPLVRITQKKKKKSLEGSRIVLNVLENHSSE